MYGFPISVKCFLFSTHTKASNPSIPTAGISMRIGVLTVFAIDPPSPIERCHIARKDWFAKFFIDLIVLSAQPLAQVLSRLGLHRSFQQMVTKVLCAPKKQQKQKRTNWMSSICWLLVLFCCCCCCLVLVHTTYHGQG
jgi:hypothetical protein